MLRASTRLLGTIADPHLVLGVATNASRREIRSAFNALAKQHHPDVMGGDREKFERIRKAHDQMMKPTVSTEDIDNFTFRPKRKVWEEPGMRAEDVHTQELHGAWSIRLVRLLATFVFGSIIAFGMQQDTDPDGLSWLDRPHPAVIAAQCSRQLSLKEKKELEAAIIKAGAAWNMRYKQGGGLDLPGIGYFDYASNTVRRSGTYTKQLEREHHPPPVATWKSWESINKRAGASLGTPGARPPTTPEALEERNKRDHFRLQELEQELVELKARLAQPQASA